jgi:membrane-associated protease RseP (regulator of RpoE activity)
MERTRSIYTSDNLKLKITLMAAAVFWLSFVISGCTRESSTAKPAVVADNVSSIRKAPTLGIVVDSQMKVVDIDPGSIAEKAGIQIGDILESLDGVAFDTDGQRIKQLLSQKGAAAWGGTDDVIEIAEDVSQQISPLTTVQDETLLQEPVLKETLQPASKPTAMLKLNRGDQTIQVEIDVLSQSNGFSAATPTPLWPGQGLFYY